METQVSRRAFIKAGTVAAAAAGLAGCSASSQAATSTTEEESASTIESTPVSSTDYDISQTVDTDIVVVGSGTGGSVAAIAAAQAGAKVTVLEKLSFIGGDANMAISIFSVNSQYQKDNGIEEIDTESFVLEGVDWHKNNIDRNMWKQFVEKTGENLDWYRSIGVQIGTGFWNMPTSVYACEDEKNPEIVYDSKAGTFAVAAKTAKMEELGVDMRVSTPAVKLVQTDGRVTGVIAQNADGEYIQFNAANVILACGSIAANGDLVEELTHEDYSKMIFQSYPGSTGDGYTMAKEVGGYSTGNISLGNQGQTVAGSTLGSSIMILGAYQPTNLWLNQDADRLINEDAFDYSQTANVALMQGRCYSFMDNKALEYYQENGVTRGFADVTADGTKFDDLAGDIDAAIEKTPEYVAKADTLEELAEQLNIDPEKFVASVEEYNALCAAQEDPKFGKAAENLWALDTPPYYSFRLYANILNALGGVRTNYDMQVVDRDHNPIPGLYCSGTEVEGYESKIYNIGLAGTCQAICIHTGRIAGTHAANNM